MAYEIFLQILPKDILSSASSSLLSQCCNGWARLRAKKRSRQSLWSMRLPPYSQDEEDKKRGYPSGGRPCPRWSAHVKAILLRAQCTRRCCCCTFPVSLSPFGFGLGLMHHASSLHFSYPAEAVYRLGHFSPFLSICRSIRE